MNLKKHRNGPTRGFALVVTLSLMILLTIIAVGLLSLSSIALRSSGQSSAQATAKANARMAMMLALGELQKSAGRDQSVTGPATLGQTGTITNPAWTGAWKSDDENSTPVWLVSGENADPKTALTATDSAILSKKSDIAVPGTAAAEDLRASWVKVDGKDKGRYAYWIGDEGTKAKVDITRPTGNGANERERYARAQSPQENGLLQVNKDVFTGFEPGGTVSKQALISMGTVALAATEAGGITQSELPSLYLHDLTSGGYGLPVNVKDGGMKADLSLVFDRSQQSKPYVASFLGARPVKKNLLSAKINGFPTVSDPQKFYLSEQINDNFAAGTGPNWGNLFTYARLWEDVTANQIPVTGIDPLLDTDLVRTNWAPYTNSGNGGFNTSDTQHKNSSVAPVVSVIQMGFYLGARGPIQVTLKNGKKENRYQAELHIKPIVGLWNPYNVAIKSGAYKIAWAMQPYFRFAYAKPVGNKFPPSNYITEVWLRDYWKSNYGSVIPAEGEHGGSYLQLETDPVDFQPGEFRLFSVEANPDITSGVNKLVPKLDPKGTFRIDINRSSSFGSEPIDQAGQPLLVPAGNYGWFGDVYLQDTQWDGATAYYGVGTRQHIKDTYNKDLDPRTSSSWFTLKAKGSPDSHLQRFTNLWNGGTFGDLPTVPMPEPVISDYNNLTLSGANGKQPHLVDKLATGDRGHIATWRFFIRNPTEVEESAQGLRGWTDSNPRVAAANLRFDGSKSSFRGREGWNAASNLIGGAHRTGAPAGTVGDGKGGDRGLVAEGNKDDSIFPDSDISGGRWKGYGGPSSTSATGFANVILYDVPRSPLTSVGQFQHAQLSRYNYEPGFVVGNSYANPRIPLNATSAPKFGDPNFEMVDISYEVNKRLWDSVFFSTLAPDYKTSGSTAGNYDTVFKFQNLVSGATVLSNPRMKFAPQGGDKSITAIIDEAGDKAPQALASRILIDGGFNVNSTSKTAWKAILSSMGGTELPVISPTIAPGAATWSAAPKDGIRFNRFSTVILDSGYKKGDGLTEAFWQGWRELSDDELDKLAEQIVVEVKARGPFRTFAEFVNRDPNSQTIAFQSKGALQAALDRTVNTAAAIPTSIALPASNPEGTAFSQAVDGENQAVGHAGYLMQGDVLQSLAPVLQVRSDYFRIRTCGEAFAADGKTVLATAICEAFVQRTPEYTDTADKPEIATADLGSKVNQTFGRRFQLVSFRWLSSTEI